MKKMLIGMMVAVFLIFWALPLPVEAVSTTIVEKIKQLISYTLDPEKGTMIKGRPMLFLEKTEKVKEGVERRLYFVVTFALTPRGVAVVEVFCNEESWETKKVGEKKLTLVTQKMSVDGGNFMDAFVVKDEDGSVIESGSKPADSERGEIWLNEFLDEMLQEFGQPSGDPDFPPKGVKWNV